MKTAETVFKLGLGVDRYNPDIADGLTLKFRRLKNLQPIGNRLVTPRGLSSLQSIAGETNPIRGYGYYNVPTSGFTSLYAFSNTSIYQFEFGTQQFSTPGIYTSFPDSEHSYARVPWLDALYVTKRFGKLVKLQGSVATEVSGAPGGRYMTISDSHLMLANTCDGSTEYPVRVQWSDLYAPESFTVGPASEADFFELSPDDGEITGLSYQRGATLVYTRDRVWIGRYFASSDGTTPGRYKFEPLFSGVGNIYHDAQIRIKEVDYFIGADNIYRVDGFQLTEVGDEVWAYFKETIADANFQDSVIAIHLEDQESIMWIYNHVDGGRWSIVYNYKENKWSDRDPEDIYCGVYLTFPVRGFIPYEDLVGSYEDMDTTYPPAPATYDGDWQYLDTSIRILFGGVAGRVFVPSDPSSYVKYDDSAFSCELETYEFDFDELQEVKEIHKLKLLFSARSGDIITDTDMVLRVGTRRTRAEDVVWSDPVTLVSQVTGQLAGETIFHIRNKGVGKLIRFKLSWTNNINYAVTELVKLSLFKIENGDTTPEK
jgi:hypothetical protein